MNNSGTEEQIKDLHQNLIYERKKAKELELQLQRLQFEVAATKAQLDRSRKNLQDKNGSSEEKIRKLRKLAFAYKKKFQQSLTELNTKNEEIKSLQEQHKALKFHIESGQKETKNENLALMEERNKLKEKYTTLQQDYQKIRDKLEVTINQLHSAERLIISLNRNPDQLQQSSKQYVGWLEGGEIKALEFQDEIIQKLAASEEYIAELEKETQKQKIENAERLQILQKELEELQKSKEQYLKEIEQIKKEYQEKETSTNQFLETEKINIENKMKNTLLHSEQLERAVQFLRERNEEAQLELKQLQTEYDQCEEAFEVKVKELSQHKQEIDHLTQLLATSQEEKKETLNEIYSIRTQFRQLKDRVHAAESVQKTSHNLVEEKEISLKHAQQHLGKKVKECALLTEKLEEQKAIVFELRDQLSRTEARMQEIQKRLESQLEREKTLQAQIQQWEEKYFKVYDKWQEANNQNQELKKLEEKHNQLQSILMNLGTVVSSSPTQTTKISAPKETVVEAPKPKKEESETDFFNGSKNSANKNKKNLFE